MSAGAVVSWSANYTDVLAMSRTSRNVASDEPGQVRDAMSKGASFVVLLMYAWRDHFP